MNGGSSLELFLQLNGVRRKWGRTDLTGFNILALSRYAMFLDTLDFKGFRPDVSRIFSGALGFVMVGHLDGPKIINLRRVVPLEI